MRIEDMPLRDQVALEILKPYTASNFGWAGAPNFDTEEGRKRGNALISICYAMADLFLCHAFRAQAEEKENGV